MKVKHQCFIITANTLSMRKTSDILFLSQQAVSTHIKNLEDEYDTKFFFRKPKLRLTESGMAFLKTLEKFTAIENNFKTELKSIHGEHIGKIRFGIGVYRVHAILPKILKAFSSKYPQVEIEIVYGETKEFEKMLEQGKIDLFLGFNTKYHPGFVHTLVCCERSFFLISENMLAKYFSDKDIVRFQQHGIILNELHSVPLILNSSSSKVRDIFEEYFHQLHVQPVKRLIVGDYVLQINLCADDYGACFCPEMLIPTVRELNACRTNKLHLFKIQNLPGTNNIELIHDSFLFKSEFIKCFIDLIQSNNKIDDSFADIIGV